MGKNLKDSIRTSPGKSTNKILFPSPKSNEMQGNKSVKDIGQ